MVLGSLDIGSFKLQTGFFGHKPTVLTRKEAARFLIEQKVESLVKKNCMISMKTATKTTRRFSSLNNRRIDLKH